MACELRLVGGHVLDGDHPLARLQRNDPVDEEERIAVRDDAHDVGRLERQCQLGPPHIRHRVSGRHRSPPLATKAAGPTRSSRLVLTSAPRKAALSTIPRWNGRLVLTPAIWNSASARRDRASAISLVSPHTISLASSES